MKLCFEFHVNRMSGLEVIAVCVWHERSERLSEIVADGDPVHLKEDIE